MKILFVSVRGPTNESRRGGAQDYMQFVSSPWINLNHSVTILCGQETLNDHLLPVEEYVDGLHVIRVGSPQNRAKPIRKKTKDIMCQYDVIIENIMGFPLFLPTIIKGKPLVALKHHFEGASFLQSQGVIKGSIGMFLENILQPLFYRKTPFIVVSEVTKRVLESRWLKPAAEVCVVPPGIQSNDCGSGAARNTEPTVIYYGALDTGRKKVDHLIKAFREVVVHVPDARLIIGGKGPDAQALRQLAGELPVEFRGFLSEQDKVTLLAQGWVFASPSMTEGFGITWVEANSAGLPVVIYDLGLDTVDDSCSISVDKGDIHGLAMAMIKLLSNKALLESMAQPSRENASRFDWRRSSENFIGFLKRALEKGQR